jgi:hypothetical protein
LEFDELRGSIMTETTALPWYKNRKIMAPIIGSLATILVTVIKYRIPDFNLSADQFTQFLTFIWAGAIALAVGDVGFDWLGQIMQIMQLALSVLEERKQPPAVG